MKFRRNLYLRPAGGQTAPQLIQGRTKDDWSGQTEHSLQTGETTRLLEYLRNRQFIRIEIEEKRDILVNTSDIQSAEVEVIRE